MAQSLKRSLGLHCLLYLVADRICVPETHPDGSVADALKASEHRLARVVGRIIEHSKESMRNPAESAHMARISVPCRPTVEVLRMDLASRLLMAALLECRDMGRLKLRLGEPSGSKWKRVLGSGGRVQATSLAGPALDGLCGRIIERLDRKGERGAKRLLEGAMGYDAGGDWVIAMVESELAERGYARQTVVRRWLAWKVQTVVDCERIQTLAEDCALAMDRWDRTWAANVAFSHALLADCMKSLEPAKGGGGA